MADLVFGAIADDDTGASDLAGMLAEQGVRTLLVLDLPDVDQFIKWSNGYKAVVMAERTRNIAAGLAAQRTRQALHLLAKRQPRVIQIKYCSTFDSTAEGNIGQTIDAAMDELNETFTVALPALPVNGRTTYQGYHFVHEQLLSDSPMRDHPLTAMTTSNLVDLLGRQTRRRVGLAPYREVERGPDRLKQCFDVLRERGVEIALMDCVDDDQLETICRAVADMRLITGSSAFGMKLPAIWRERGWIKQDDEIDDALVDINMNVGTLVVAGSCSLATRQQNESFTASGVLAYHVDAVDLLEGKHDTEILVKELSRRLARGEDCLLTTSGTPDRVNLVQQLARSRGLKSSEAGELIASSLADLVLEVLAGQPVRGLVIAGGETSGAVCRRLDLGALRVGRNIEPGVPLCFSLGKFRLPVVLKSGNFGGADFYTKAIRGISGNK